MELILKLHEYDLLDDADRNKVIDSLFKFAQEGDLYALEDEDVQKLFKGDEFAIFKDKVRAEIVPKLSDIRYDFESNYDRGGINEADEHMEHYLDALKTIKETFEDSSIHNIIDQEESRAQDWISENKGTKYEKPSRKLDLAKSEKSFITSRNIFDDIAD